MRVLWITNIMLPPICEAMNYPAIATGGWLFSSLERIQEINDIDFAVATVYNGRELLSKEIENVKYYLLPLNGQNNTKYQINNWFDKMHDRDVIRKNCYDVINNHFNSNYQIKILHETIK